MVTQSLQQQLDLEANHRVVERQTKYNLESGEEYVGLTKTTYWNMILDRKVLKTED
jgi:hypothetical protein